MRRWLQPILDATPTTLSFFQAVTNVSLAANQYASKINAVESTNPGGRLDLSQIVSQADPTKYFTCVPVPLQFLPGGCLGELKKKKAS